MLSSKNFEVYLSAPSSPIVVYTDHNPLVFIHKMKNQNQRFLCSDTARCSSHHQPLPHTLVQLVPWCFGPTENLDRSRSPSDHKTVIYHCSDLLQVDGADPTPGSVLCLDGSEPTPGSLHFLTRPVQCTVPVCLHPTKLFRCICPVSCILYQAFPVHQQVSNFTTNRCGEPAINSTIANPGLSFRALFLYSYVLILVLFL